MEMQQFCAFKGSWRHKSFIFDSRSSVMQTGGPGGIRPVAFHRVISQIKKAKKVTLSKNLIRLLQLFALRSRRVHLQRKAPCSFSMLCVVSLANLYIDL